MVPGSFLPRETSGDMKGPYKSFCEGWTQDLHVLSLPTYGSVTCELPVCGTGKAVYQTALINPSTYLDLELT